MGPTVDLDAAVKTKISVSVPVGVWSQDVYFRDIRETLTATRASV
jgi:hypothetical protein